MKQERISFVTALSYKMFGKITRRFTFGAFKDVYQRSGIRSSYEIYVAHMFFASSTAFVSALVVGALLHRPLFSLTSPWYYVAVLSFSYIVTMTVSIAFIMYPVHRQGQRKRGIDANLVYTAGYMGVLSAGGIPIERIFERVADVEQHAPIRTLTQRLITNIKMFGLDVSSSLRDITLHSPSEAFSKLLTGITNTVKTSGDLTSLLTFETERLLHAKREQLKKTLGTLTVLGEVYITAIVMGPIVFIVMLTILSIMGNIVFGLSPAEQLNLLVFFGLPAVSAVFIVVLNSVLPGEE